jgi:sortase A
MTIRITPPRSAPYLSRWFLRWSAPLILCFFGCCALGYCGYAMLDARISQRNESRQFDQAVLAAHPSGAANLSTTPPAMPVFGGADNPSSGTPGGNVAEDIPLGRIEITAIGFSAMIQEGTAPHTLQRGVGHITGTSSLGESGNIGLAGHRDTFFRKLRNIQVGDEITLTTLAGSFLYQVELISIVEPEDSQVLRNSGGDFLTLVTCYPFSFVGPAPKRFIVRAREIARTTAESSVAEPPLHL